MSLVERVWFGEDAAAAAGRAALWPLSLAYEGAMRARATLYDAGVFASEQPALPTISVGNLTVGGTGKTPFAAWLAGELSASVRPAVVLRGYGGDESEVHRRLNPGIPVVANPDRARGIAEAKRQGAEVTVLDDAFQHRRVARQADIVVLSAEQMLRPRRLLPVGPWRESLSALRRADLIVVTRKSAGAAESALAIEIARRHSDADIASVHLAPAALAGATDGEQLPLERLRGESVLAIAAIGEPELFRRQLVRAGAQVSLAAFRDHHAFSDAEVANLAGRAGKGMAVCTLKDAVKLAGRWPGPSRLWYVSQQLVVDQGAEHVTRLIKRVLSARAAAAPSAG